MRRTPALLGATTGALLLWLLLFSVEAQAAIDSSDVLDNVLARYSAAASMWAATITARASWLFWTLALISMVWTFGMLALRKADIGEFYAEFARFTIFTGFFWWLLTNGPTFATDIMNSLRTIGGTASGTGPALSPSGIVDIGFTIFYQVLDRSSGWSPVDSAAGILISAAILIILALIGVNMLLLLVSGWVLAYAGVFFLGFGGSRWTSDMAIHYYKTVLGIAAQLLTMVLLVGIGKSFVDQYYASMSAGLSLKELGVMLIVSVVLLALVNKLPALIGGLAMHGGTHALGGGFGTGAAMGAAAMAGAAVATGGAAIAAGAANAAGGVQALMTAASKASQNVAGGTDIVSRMAGGMADAVGGGGASGSAAGLGSPLAGAMDGPAMSGSSSSGTTSGGSRASSSSKGNAAKGSTTGNSKARAAGQTPGQQPQGGEKSALGTVGRVATDAAANLVKGSWDVAKERANAGAEAAQERLSQTVGGKVAAAIKAQGTTATSSEQLKPEPTFDGNSLSGASDTSVDADSEVSAFRDRDTHSPSRKGRYT
ncbi:P-type conjugative transfer protein TrbL [Accumulibacter sp.]|uniref:P-type conjugative transfer protein TrbL n=1 Tax=Accumulibacter sp. TaxID=2053492 RepID=UPI0025FE83C4|nr:P-type conjugative transfer protein TrbL [Accumulibacter sp.]MCP5230373.1 P-type conjugative transfer protein TrbL [Accumulibacter sp.]